MKKLLLALVAGSLSLAAQAQNEETLKATAGDIAVEANVGITNGNVNLSNALNQIKGRYFLSDDMALRLGFNVSRQSFSMPGGGIGSTINRSDFMFSINPGIEKHFAGTNRLSPYIGAELSFAVRSLEEDSERPDGNYDYTMEGGWTGNQRGYTSVGVNGVAGMDFYVARHLYVGYELGFGIHFKNEADIERATSAGVTVTDGDSSLDLGPRVLNGVRVGFVF
ncbi:MAG: outer membrane beta-barrel protein [Hymenobacteraceae bacterium]|nr:outer membrane beta-barrel protein [Hymenobacteraceae bacterium]MDX5395554.1 outer membrane beta-barrel protein [Hymenobacteraceae bacterium]MDX5443980.1 outer membrane beta-barrel protein [Hymenobacteraceae bacterium]MDX5511608.1 outer membrane beta-barrel protein [Hymenobacteraceae bacterium]